MNTELATIVWLFLTINKHKLLISSSGIKEIERNFFSLQFYADKLLIIFEKIESATTYSDELLAQVAQDFPDFVQRINASVYRSDDMMSVLLDRRRNLFFSGPFKGTLSDGEKRFKVDLVTVLERLLTVSEKINTYLGVELMPSCEIKRGRKDLQELKRLITKLQEYVHSIDPAAITSKKKAEIVLINIEAFLTRISIYIATIDYATRIMQDHYELYKEQQRPGSLMKKYLF